MFQSPTTVLRRGAIPGALIVHSKRSSNPHRRTRIGAEKDEPKKSDPEKIDFSVDFKEEFKRGVEFGNTEIKPRFTAGAISSADRGLPIADALVCISAQVLVALAALGSGGAFRPSWLVPNGLFPNWRSLPYLLSALLHGSKLACVWTAGALAGRAYEREAFDASLPEAMKRTVSSGCFAVGLLILITQVDVHRRFAELELGDSVQFGESPSGDLVLSSAASDLFLDCASEAVAMTSWRFLRWNSSPTAPPGSER